MFQCKAILRYDVFDPRSARKGQQPWWLIVVTPSSVRDYYAHWAKKELDLELTPPIWKNHCSVVKGERPKNIKAWRKYENQVVEISYSHEVCTSNLYAWLPVQSEQLEEIRLELGLSRLPYHPFHLTLGNFKNEQPKPSKAPPVTLFPWERPSKRVNHRIFNYGLFTASCVE